MFGAGWTWKSSSFEPSGLRRTDESVHMQSQNIVYWPQESQWVHFINKTQSSC